jgi:hypothetical protein
MLFCKQFKGLALFLLKAEFKPYAFFVHRLRI